MTARTKAELLDLYPDNQTGAIGPEDLRDGVDTYLGCYGMISGTAEAQAGVTTAAVKAEAFDDVGPEDNATGDSADDSITLDIAGTYELRAQFTGTGPADTGWFYDLALDGVGLGLVQSAVTDGAGNSHHVSLGAIAVVTAGQKVTVLVNSSEAGGANITWATAVLTARKVG